MKLTNIFNDQDATLRRHLSSSPLFRKAFDLLSDACHLGTQMTADLPFEGEKKKVLTTFSVEIINVVAVAARLALWGNSSESLAILRNAIERCAQLMFIVGEKKYKTAVYEMQAKFDQVSYQTAISSMGSLGQRIKNIHGEISQASTHATAARLAWYLSQKENKLHFGPGFEVNDPRVAICLKWCLDSCQILLSSIKRAHDQDGIAFKWTGQYQSVEQRFLDLKAEFDVALGRVSNPTAPAAR